MDELFDPEFVRHDPNRGDLLGKDKNEQFIRTMRAAFPDLHFTIDDVISQGDKVVTRYHFAGTHLGDALGFPPTQKKVNYSGVLIQRFVGGKIIEQWTEADLLSLFQQLGVIPKLK
jgi:predicted ester cyclase